ncbi:putative membrane protein [Lachnellula subtilissima]|uniref:Putative membrane protein n=1 Tax=Lachnellula subtilissima TaxID=602034 RepID=A0A8H8RWF2_9HELO|nr:putative membrane protein [Lachnellula subtilissima]
MWQPHFHVYVAVAMTFQAIPLTATPMNASTEDVSSSSIPAESYFRDHTSSNLLYAHIIFMFLAWICALPISIMLNIAKSNLRYPSHIAFLGFHGIGTVFGWAYNSRTPDLYPRASHNNLGWALSALIFAHFIIGIIKDSIGRTSDSGTKDERAPFIAEATGRMTREEERNMEASNQPSRSSSSRAASPYPELSESSIETDSETLFDVHLHYSSRLENRYEEPMTWSRQWANVSGSNLLVRILDLWYVIVDRGLPILGFVAICTGIVTTAGIFHEKHIFNGLAHFIKGGVFVGIGIITLGRWTGCFADFGWAWNLKPSNLTERTASMSMETVECFVIFLYGITNVFLEHLSAWGEAWVPQDFEHVAISLLFIGGGLCGLMVESKALRRLVKAYPEAPPPNSEFSKHLQPQLGISINPIPAMIIFLLGMILGGHHQMSTESTMMHKQFGNLLISASAARCCTYLLLQISPPTSIYPSRPPSELVCSFCFICGGFMLMASNRDTVQSMIDSGVNGMVVATVTMGITATLMAWIIFLLVVKGGKAKQDPPVSWLQTVQNTGNVGNNTSLPLAITALSLVRLGRKHQNVELQNEGMAVYGQALEGIQAILSSDDLIFEEQTLASCMTLLVFEVLETSGSNVRGWISHVNGISQLFQLRGPELHVSESSHRLFLGFRPTGIIYALATRRSSYLGDEEWLTVPWQRFPKSDFHHLLDIMARMPGLIEQTEHAISMDAILSSLTEMESLRERCWAIERQLRTWYINLVDSSTTPLRSETSPRTIASATLYDLRPLTDSSLNFPSFETARMHLFYWAALLLIYNTLTSIPSPSTSLHQCPQVHIQTEIHTTAMLIARSIPYLLSPKTQTMGPQNAFFSLRIAMHAFSELGEDREERWCRDVFKELDKRGFPFGNILPNSESPIALQCTGSNGSIANGGYYSLGSAQQQWDFIFISDFPDSSSKEKDDVKENRAWLREMLKYYTSNISQAYHTIGTYPFERSHITNPNADLRKEIVWQNSGRSS